MTELLPFVTRAPTVAPSECRSKTVKTDVIRIFALELPKRVASVENLREESSLIKKISLMTPLRVFQKKLFTVSKKFSPSLIFFGTEEFDHCLIVPAFEYEINPIVTVIDEFLIFLHLSAKLSDKSYHLLEVNFGLSRSLA